MVGLSWKKLLPCHNSPHDASKTSGRWILGLQPTNNNTIRHHYPPPIPLNPCARLRSRSICKYGPIIQSACWCWSVLLWVIVRLSFLIRNVHNQLHNTRQGLGQLEFRGFPDTPGSNIPKELNETQMTRRWKRLRRLGVVGRFTSQRVVRELLYC